VTYADQLGYLYQPLSIVPRMRYAPGSIGIIVDVYPRSFADSIIFCDYSTSIQ
jgi:hypothetical protein